MPSQILSGVPYSSSYTLDGRNGGRVTHPIKTRRYKYLFTVIPVVSAKNLSFALAIW